MNPRELTLVSTATIFGASASALAFRFFFFNHNKQSLRAHSSENGIVSRNCSAQSPFDPSKRKAYLSWDDYFMAIAFLSAERSKDPNRQVGACLALGIMVSLEVVRMTGFLGQRNQELGILWRRTAGQKLYVTMFPCHECAKIIIQSGVSEVIYFVEKRLNDSNVAYVASHKLLSMACVKVRKHQPKMDQILIEFEEP